jgi:hypothetical protein
MINFFLYIITINMVVGSCPLYYIHCVTYDGDFIGEIEIGTCWRWLQFQCRQCHSYSYYLGKCKELYPYSKKWIWEDQQE